MASNFDHVTCKQCLKLYSDPLLLPCLHSLCKKCLTKASDGQDAITCPTCNEVSTIPQHSLPQHQGLTRLVDEVLTRQKISSSTQCESCDEATAVVYCTECSEFYCTVCRDHHKVARKSKTHQLVEVGKSANIATTTYRPAQCAKHSDMVLKFYCKDCNILVCSECIVFSHKQHGVCPFDEVGEEGRGSLRNNMQGCPDIVSALDDIIGSGEKMIQSIMSRKKVVDTEINAVFAKLQEVLAERNKALLKESDTVAVAKVTAINVQLEAVRGLRDRVLHASEVTASALESREVSELLGVRKAIEDRLERLKGEFNELSGDVIENDVIMTSLEHASLSNDIAQFGAVSDIVIDTSASELGLGVAVPMATVGKVRKFGVSLKERSGGVVKSDRVGMVASLVRCGTFERVEVTSSIEEDQCALTCTPDTVGEYELSVKVRGTHISNSPYRMWVRQARDLSVLTQQHEYRLSYAIDVAVHGASGDVLILSHGGFIQVYDKDGKEKLKIGSVGNGDGQLSHPYSMALVGDIVCVADYDNSRVQKFTVAGEYLGQLGSKGSGDGQFSAPIGIAYDGNNQIVVADQGNKRVQVFTLDGTFVRAIQCNGGCNHAGVAVDNDGNIHISAGHTIQVHNSHGDKLYHYSNTAGNFVTPRGIAFDDNGYRYIMAIGHLHILDDKGDQVKVMGGFNNSFGLALDREGGIYVSEYGCNKVIKY